MLIVPVSGKIGWKHPPMVTLALLVINCLIYFVFQINDDAVRMEAEGFYLDSGLAYIEVPRYLDYLEALGETITQEEADLFAEARDGDPDAVMALHFAMEADANFSRRLLAERVITPQDTEFEEWKRLRRTYDTQCNRSTAFAFGLRPAYPRAATFVTYMFLHGGAGHLMGNMVFLWILGCMLEMGAGRVLFVGVYLLSGLMAAGFFYLIYPSSTIPLVGASGAIAGLMGAYTVLYGRIRVNVFYSLGFFFSTARIPAILLLPVWMVNECYQLFFSGVSHVAYVAHIGGLAGGAALAAAGERLMGGVDRRHFEAAPVDRLGPLMHQALEHMGNLEMNEARVLFEQVLELSPDNPDALTHLFNIHKLDPESAEFHATAKTLLQAKLRNAGDPQDALDCYETYAGLVRRPSLPISVYLQLAGIMAAAGKVDGAERILLAVLKQTPDAPGLPSSLIKLAQAFRRSGQMDCWKRYRGLICRRYPDSAEAAILSRSHFPG